MTTYSLIFVSFLFFFNSGDQTISNLEVLCENVERGCDWKGIIKTLDDHMLNCDLTLVDCTNECGAEITKRSMAHHIANDCIYRLHQCIHCGKNGKYSYISETHSQRCKKKVVTCPNDNCASEMENAELNDHLKSCEFSEVSCKYGELGCAVKKARRDISQHEDEDDCHIAAAMGTIDCLEDQVKALEQKITSFEELNLKVLKPGESYVFKVNYPNGRHFSSQHSVESQTFYTSPVGYKVSIKICFPDLKDSIGYISVYLCMEKGVYDETISWPFREKTTISILNQLSDNYHQEKTLTFSDEGINMGQSKGFKFISCDDLKRMRSQYIINGTIIFKVSFPAMNKWLIRTMT